MDAVLVLTYKCRECPENFGDPEAERGFENWAMRVKLHAFECHGRSPYYLNDVIRPAWSHETIRARE